MKRFTVGATAAVFMSLLQIFAAAAQETKTQAAAPEATQIKVHMEAASRAFTETLRAQRTAAEDQVAQLAAQLAQVQAQTADLQAEIASLKAKLTIKTDAPGAPEPTKSP